MTAEQDNPVKIIVEPELLIINDRAYVSPDVAFLLLKAGKLGSGQVKTDPHSSPRNFEPGRDAWINADKQDDPRNVKNSRTGTSQAYLDDETLRGTARMVGLVNEPRKSKLPFIAQPKVIDKKPSQVETTKRKTVAGIVALALTSTISIALALRPTEGDQHCNDAKHAVATAGTWDHMAKVITTERGYVVDVSQLLGKNGHSPNEANSAVKSGECVELPAPVVANQYVAKPGQTLKEIAFIAGIKEKDLAKLNPQLADGSKTTGGEEVWLSKKPDRSLALQPFGGDLRRLTGGNGATLKKILLANVVKFADGVVMEEGGEYYLPVTVEPTEGMAEIGLSLKQVIDANPEDYDYSKREQQTAAAPTQAPSPEVTTPAPDLHQLSESQLAAIEAMDLDANQKKFVRDMAQTIMGLSDEFIKNGIRPDIALAQAMLETGYGQDEKLVKYNNFFGMKAGNDWKGATTPDVSTGEQTNGGHIQIQTKFRAYKDMKEGVRGYIDKVVSSDWYGDMRQWFNDRNKALDGLQNQLNKDGTIEIPGKLAWATDNNSDGDGGYKGKLINMMDKLGLTNLFKIVLEKPTPPVSQPTNGNRNIHLDPSKYSKTDREPGFRDDAYVTIGGENVSLGDIDYPMRLKLIESALNKIVLSPEGYKDFLNRYVDISDQVKASERGGKKLTNFDGGKNSYGTPKPGDIKFVMWHYTVTPNDANDDPCIDIAWSMQHSGPVGSVFAINTEGKVCRLTHDNVAHAYNYYNVRAVGIEMTAGGQETVTTGEYQDGIYLTANILVNDLKVIKPGMTQSQIVKIINKMVIGHSGAGHGNNHSDNPKIVMDQIQPMVVEAVLIALANNA